MKKLEQNPYFTLRCLHYHHPHHHRIAVFNICREDITGSNERKMTITVRRHKYYKCNDNVRIKNKKGIAMTDNKIILVVMILLLVLLLGCYPASVSSFTTNSIHVIHRPPSTSISTLFSKQSVPFYNSGSRTVQSSITPQTTTTTRSSPIQRQQVSTTALHITTIQQSAIQLVKETYPILFKNIGSVPIVYSLFINIVLFTIGRTKLLKALTPMGYIHAMILGIGLWSTIGYKGWCICVLYLLFGQIVTKIKFNEKSSKGLAEGRGGRRGPENVWGSAATGLVCAICAMQAQNSISNTFLGISTNMYLLGYITSLGTKLADTFASEIGKAYGTTTFLITTFQRVPPGTEGAVSVQGTVASVVGGLLLSVIGIVLFNLLSLSSITTIISCVSVATVSAFVATTIESLLGATIQGKEGFEWITNEIINFFNTFIGASIAITYAKLFLPI